MIAICVWHTMVHGFNYKDMSAIYSPQVLHLSIMVICVPAVDTFMFISGFYGIRFSYDKLLRLIIQALLISNIIIFFRLPFGGSFSFYDQVLPISSGLTWWFLSVYVIIMVFSPILNAGIDNIDTKTFRNILIILFFVFSVVKFQLDGGGYNMITLTLIYLLGRYCKKSRLAISRKKSILLWITSVSILFSIIIYHYYNDDYNSIWVILSYNNPIIILMAMAIFYFTISFKNSTKMWALFLGSHSLSIYLISEMLGYSLYNSWKNIFDYSICLFLLSITLFSIICEFIDIPLQSLNCYLRNITYKVIDKITINCRHQ